MPQYPLLHPNPIDHLAKRQVWPEGRLKSNSPVEAEVIKRIAERLHKHKREHKYTQKKMAELGGVGEDALSRLMRGESWGTLSVISRLEKNLGIDLWCPKRHKGPDDW